MGFLFLELRCCGGAGSFDHLGGFLAGLLQHLLRLGLGIGEFLLYQLGVFKTFFNALTALFENRENWP